MWTRNRIRVKETVGMKIKKACYGSSDVRKERKRKNYKIDIYHIIIRMKGPSATMAVIS